MTEPHAFCNKCNCIHGAWSCPKESLETTLIMAGRIDQLRQQLEVCQKEKQSMAMDHLAAEGQWMEQLEQLREGK